MNGWKIGFFVFLAATAGFVAFDRMRDNETNIPGPSAAPRVPAPSAAPAPADPDDLPATREQKLKLCKTYGEIAGTVMEGRQNGVAMSKAIEHAEGSQIFETIVAAAYEQPLMRSPENARKQREEFTNDIYLRCYTEYATKG